MKQWVSVGRREIELSNLEKVLDPSGPSVKAEVVKYYLHVAPTMLRHIRGRPLSLVRFPDGVEGERFFQKNRPKWAPEWMPSVTIGDVEYMVADGVADLVWLANLACLELHPMQGRLPDPARPDQIVFDLDPPEDLPFGELAELAARLGDHLRAYDYHPFVKTTGQKGVHVTVPIEPDGDFDVVFAAAKEIAETFVRAHGTQTTLKMAKEARVTKVLVDIYRNRLGQTAVAPYSLRGRPGLAVSTPVTWEELARLDASSAFSMQRVLDRIDSGIDPWEAMPAYAVALHTLRGAPKPVSNPESLDVYAGKRRFEKTPEPEPVVASAVGHRFVIHRHHASRLHYDLRLEQDGVLQSWAVPKGMPPRPGIKRLAVMVETHPVEYTDFEGIIPKGEYGGGPMWIYAHGRYTITKTKKDGFYFSLHSPELNADYRMHQTKDNQWLLERVDDPSGNWLAGPVAPMLCERREDVPAAGEWLYEVKWDGIRAIIVLEDQSLRIYTRNGRDVTDRFPELQVPEAFSATNAVLDGEIVCLDDAGKPEFGRVIRRLQRAGERVIATAATRDPVHCYLFDALYLDGRPILREPLERRRAWVEDLVRDDMPYRVSRAVEEGALLFQAARAQNLEGIVAKEKGSTYLPGRRSASWLKVKVRRTATCLIVGYTAGTGGREQTLGALQLAENGEHGLSYRGKVGTGFSASRLSSVREALDALPPATSPFDGPVESENETTWVEPRLACDVAYASETPAGTFREPVFIRLRPDLSIDTI